MVGDGRGQAFALEGVVAGLLVVLALLFAFQAQVVTPTTGGGVDSETREQLRTTADDALHAATADGGLSHLVRHWDPVFRRFAPQANATGVSRVPGSLGPLLNRSLVAEGHQFRLVLSYRGPPGSDGGSSTVVDGGRPPAGAVAASHAVTIYDNMTLTAPDVGARELWEYDTSPSNASQRYYPVPDAVAGPVYNVVHVRVIAW